MRTLIKLKTMKKLPIIIIIPAKSKSQRIPGKNMKLLNGIPLLKWTLTFCLNIQSTIFVSSDSQKWLKIAQSWGANAILRPPVTNLHQTDLDVLKHALVDLQDRSILRDNHGLIAYMRPTTPFREVKVVKRAIKFMQLHPEYTGLRSVEEMGESAFKSMILDLDGLLWPISTWDKKTGIKYQNHSRKWQSLHNVYYQSCPTALDSQGIAGGVQISDLPNQMLPPTYKANGYVDIARVSEVLQDRLWGCNCYGFVTLPTIEIDTPEDWERAEWWATRHGGS